MIHEEATDNYVARSGSWTTGGGGVVTRPCCCVEGCTQEGVCACTRDYPLCARGSATGATTWCPRRLGGGEDDYADRHALAVLRGEIEGTAKVVGGARDAVRRGGGRAGLLQAVDGGMRRRPGGGVRGDDGGGGLAVHGMRGGLNVGGGGAAAGHGWEGRRHVPPGAGKKGGDWRAGAFAAAAAAAGKATISSAGGAEDDADMVFVVVMVVIGIVVLGVGIAVLWVAEGGGEQAEVVYVRVRRQQVAGRQEKLFLL